VRPDCLPLAASRSTRSGDEPGKHRVLSGDPSGPATPSSSAAHHHRSMPCTTPLCVQRLQEHEPSAISVKSRSNVIGRSLIGCAGRRGVTWVLQCCCVLAMSACGAAMTSPHYGGQRPGQWLDAIQLEGRAVREPSSRKVSTSPLDQKRRVRHPRSVSQQTQGGQVGPSGCERRLVSRRDEHDFGARSTSPMVRARNG
jgi:hypothetical protein